MTDKKVYLAVSGIYDDFNIHGIFDDEALCDEFISRYIRDEYVDDLHKEVYKVNPYAKQVAEGLTYFCVEITRAGVIGSCMIEIPDTDISSEGLPCVRIFIRDVSWLGIRCWARDEQHARKIAEEKRQEVEAAGRWNKEGAF